MTWQRQGGSNNNTFGNLGNLASRRDDFMDRDNFRSNGVSSIREFERNFMSNRDTFSSNNGMSSFDRMDLVQRRNNFSDDLPQRNNYNENNVRELLSLMANNLGQQQQQNNFQRNNMFGVKDSGPFSLMDSNQRMDYKDRMDYQPSSRYNNDIYSRDRYSDRRPPPRQRSSPPRQNFRDRQRFVIERVKHRANEVRQFSKRRLGYIERQCNVILDMGRQERNGKITTIIKAPRDAPNSIRNLKKAVEMLNKMMRVKGKMPPKSEPTRNIKSENKNIDENKSKLSKRDRAMRDRGLQKNLRVDESCIIKINLRLSIVDNELITEERSNILKQHLSKKVDEALESGIVVKFRYMSLIKGELRVTCVDEKSLEWLKKTVNEIPSLWENSNIQFKFVDTKHHYRIRAFFPGPLKSNDMVLKLLGGQNPTVSVAEWEIYHIDEKEDGGLYYIGVDEASLHDLIKIPMKMYYEFSYVIFRLLRSGFQQTEAVNGNQ